jgi:ABC-type multidrug transport system fused ATPase/permease subunit
MRNATQFISIDRLLLRHTTMLIVIIILLVMILFAILMPGVVRVALLLCIIVPLGLAIIKAIDNSPPEHVQSGEAWCLDGDKWSKCN